ncbi:MAG: hypothetical protein M0T79_02745 [Actinomycetota bacterium]|nr:hypothetical protein [Actinomycetota bacterium]
MENTVVSFGPRRKLRSVLAAAAAGLSCVALVGVLPLSVPSIGLQPNRVTAAGLLLPKTTGGPKVVTRVAHVNSTKPPYAVVVRAPQLKWPGHAGMTTRFDARVAALVKGLVVSFIARDARDEAHLSSKTPAARRVGHLSLDYQTTRVTTGVVSVLINSDIVYPGQADVTEIPAGLTVELRTGDVPSLASQFRAPAKYPALLAREVLPLLETWRPSGDRCYVGRGKGPAPRASSFAAWSLDSDGLVLAFPGGVYTAAYCGIPVVTIPYSTLSAVAAPGSLIATHGVAGK